MKLFHGSVWFTEELKAATPRGNTEFNSKKGIYATKNFNEAVIYALTRNKENTNKSWGVAWLKDKPYLICKKEKWKGPEPKYKLNDHGYVYELDARGIQNPDPAHKSEHRIDKDSVSPKIIYRVTDKDIKNRKYVPEAQWEKFWSKYN